MAIIKAATSPYDFRLVGDVQRVSLPNNPNLYYPDTLEECMTIFALGSSASMDIPSLGEYWIAFYFLAPTVTVTTGSPGFFLLRNKALDADMIRMRMVNATNMQLTKRNPDGGYSASANFTWAGNTLYRFDIHVKVDSVSGSYTVYRNGVQIAQINGDIGNGGIDELRFAKKETTGSAFGTGIAISHVIVADEDTRTLKMFQRLATGEGQRSGWSGTYTDINEIGTVSSNSPINVASFNEATTYNSKVSFPGRTLASIDGADILAVVHSAYGIATVDGIGVKPYERVGGTDLTPAALAPFRTTWGGSQAVQHLNPATGNKYTTAELETGQFGMIMSPAA